ncbi:hypothetical protein [Nesterenkonia sp. CF4.4]|uniref:hypothetical protein n=1 Tax=Nesterenkonia sp. CF4.4 TaxID=3373079 RepID=UPI003EE4B11E
MFILRPAGLPGTATDSSADPDDATRALYDERRKLLDGLMAPAAESWEELSEGLKERWRRTSERAATR